jgi:hypothetical protein
VRGTGAVYIQSRGRWNSGSSPASSVSSHDAERPSPDALPAAPRARRAVEPIRIQSPSPLDSAGAG